MKRQVDKLPAPMNLIKRMLLVAGAVVLPSGCGGGSGQSPECKSYVECLDKTSTGTQMLREAYGASGSCWKTDKAAADLCTSGCQQTLEALKRGYPDAGC